MIRTLALLLACFSVAAAADVTGKWNVTATTSSGREYKLELELKNEGGKLAGVMSSPEGNIPLENVQLNGDELTYRLPVGGGYAIKFTVAGDTMKGTYTSSDGATGPTVATRANAAASGQAGFAGTWKGLARSEPGNRSYDVSLDLAVEGGKVSGTITAPQGSAPIESASADGNNLTFKVTSDEGTYTIKLALAGNEMNGSYAGPAGETGKITMQRK